MNALRAGSASDRPYHLRGAPRWRLGLVSRAVDAGVEVFAEYLDRQGELCRRIDPRAAMPALE